MKCYVPEARRDFLPNEETIVNLGSVPVTDTCVVIINASA